ncbi:MAG: M48 family metallopeptidase [Pseudomonadota bacterium]
MRAVLSLSCAAYLAGCVVTETPPAPSVPDTTPHSNAAQSSTARLTTASIQNVIRTVEPVAERECRRRSPDLNCDFKIVFDTDPRKPPNAFQTLERSGRPVVGFTVSLLRTARNVDEIAFVMGHETAHHIERHLQRQQQSAVGGALIGGLGAAVLGLDPSVGRQIGGSVGARVYSKDNELEADALGTVIAARAGFDPVRGAAFFTRIPDPGDRFLGTHPPNAQRISTVRRVASQL